MSRREAELLGVHVDTVSTTSASGLQARDSGSVSASHQARGMNALGLVVLMGVLGAAGWFLYAVFNPAPSCDETPKALSAWSSGRLLMTPQDQELVFLVCEREGSGDIEFSTGFEKTSSDPWVSSAREACESIRAGLSQNPVAGVGSILIDNTATC